MSKVSRYLERIGPVKRAKEKVERRIERELGLGRGCVRIVVGKLKERDVEKLMEEGK